MKRPLDECFRGGPEGASTLLHFFSVATCLGDTRQALLESSMSLLSFLFFHKFFLPSRGVILVSFVGKAFVMQMIEAVK